MPSRPAVGRWPPPPPRPRSSGCMFASRDRQLRKRIRAADDKVQGMAGEAAAVIAEARADERCNVEAAHEAAEEESEGQRRADLTADAWADERRNLEATHEAAALAVERKVEADKPDHAARLSAAASKLAVVGRAAPGWACRACVALLVYTVVGFCICRNLPTAETALVRAVVGDDDQAIAMLLQQGTDAEHGNQAAVPLVGRFLYD